MYRYRSQNLRGSCHLLILGATDCTKCTYSKVQAWTPGNTCVVCKPSDIKYCFIGVEATQTSTGSRSVPPAKSICLCQEQSTLQDS